MSGFITLQRKVRNHPLFRNDPARLGAWTWLLMTACWRDTEYDIKGKTVTLKRGQLCASRHQLAKEWGWSPSAVERYLTRLQTEQMIGRETGQGRSIITICNYSKYQDKADKTGQASGQEAGQESDRNRTAKEQGNKVIPLSNDNGADSDKQFWDGAKAYLGNSKAGMIGRWVSRYGQEETAKAITAAQIARAVDPIPYIERVLRGSQSQAAEPIC